MPTDDERRLLADNMRVFDVIGDAIGRYWLSGTLFGMDISARSEERIRDGMHRLVNFIDPDTTSDTTKSAEDTTKCDREALLEVATELESAGFGCDVAAVRAGWLIDNAGRIREACGEE